MSIRRIFFFLLVAVALLLATGMQTTSLNSNDNSDDTIGLVAGRNVNMVPFPRIDPDSGQLLWNTGDPYLQRQNEPSIAVSTRNPLHLLAGANDYRSLDMDIPYEEIPGVEKTASSYGRDAWLGVFKSFDGGQTWESNLLPGCFYADTTPPGALPSPLLGYSAAADPVVRAGTNGLFYYCGIAFHRQTKEGVVFVSRFIDNNNKETGDCIEYIDTQIIAISKNGQFLDKPWIAVDLPHGHGQKVMMNDQLIPHHNVYLAFSVFSFGKDDSIKSEILFARSTDCGETWRKSLKLSKGHDANQGANIAVDPRGNGHVYVTWRRFGKNRKPDAVFVARSANGGKKFHKIIELATIDPFDQPTSGVTFRTNDYPTMTVDNKGRVYVAWSQRGFGPAGYWSRIVLSTSRDGHKKWSNPEPIDETGSEHQFMPSLTYAGGKLMMVFYDQRFDVAINLVDPCPPEFDDWWIEEICPYRHTIDVRAAQADPSPSPVFSGSIQVSRYPWILLTDSEGNPIGYEQLKYNMPNLPIFMSGTVPFFGDYIDVAPSPLFVPKDNGKGWEYNTDQETVYHAVWTDNRDVIPPGLGALWSEYNPPTPEGDCGNPAVTGVRNQNIYTSRISEGIIAGSPGNTKPLNMKRAFVVFVRNTTENTRYLTLTLADVPEGVEAEFLLAGDPYPELPITVHPHSSTSATVSVERTEGSFADEYAAIRINVLDEEGGLLTYILLNPDSTNPFLDNPDVDYETPHIGSEGETRNPRTGSPLTVNWDYDETSPHIGSERDPETPHIGSEGRPNDDWVTPHIGSGDDGRDDNVLSPHIGSGRDVDPENSSLTDVIFEVQNQGNTTATYSLSTFPIELPEGIEVQVLVYRVYYTPTAVGCDLELWEHQELIFNNTTPHIGSNGRNGGARGASILSQNIPNGIDGTFHIEAGGTAYVGYRFYNPDKVGIPFEPEEDLKDLRIDVGGDAPNTFIDGTEEPAPSNLVITTTSADLQDGIVNTDYSHLLNADGGYSENRTRTWSFDPEKPRPAWLLIDSETGEIYGTPNTVAGTYTFTFEVRDEYIGPYGPRPALTDTKELSINVYDQLVISTTSLPDGIVGVSYNQTLTAIGGNGDYTWTLESGSLPVGLSLSSGGVINGGAPTSSGTFNFTVEVTDTSNPPQTAQQALSIAVIQPHTITTPNIPSGPTSGIPDISYTFSTGGSACSWGDDVEYRFDWDDGNQSSWSSSTSASHSWDTAGTYNVKAQAKCTAEDYVVSAWSDALTVTINEPDFEIAYVYSTDTTTANSYKDFLEGKGYPTSLIHMDSIVTGMFADYGLILIGTDTGYTGTWGDSGKVAAVNDSGKPIIGLGEGGYAFFGKLNLAIGWGNGWHGSKTEIIVVDSSHDVFNTPNNLGVSTGQAISIYSSTGHVGINLPTPPENVVLLGREVTDPDHYPLVQEDERYLLWGWTASPDSMTQMGKDLFENVVNWSAAILYYKDDWDIPGDLAGWRQNTTGTVLEVVDTGGNPGGYLSTQNEDLGGEVFYPYAGAATGKTELTDNYSSASTTKISFDLNVFNGLGAISAIHLRFRYKDATKNGWRYLLSNPATMNVWNTYTVTFDPNWTDSEATAAGWLNDGDNPGFSATLADVYYVEVRIQGSGPMSLGIDNFTRLDIK